MNSIDAGKHSSNFTWFSGRSDSFKNSLVSIAITDSSETREPIDQPQEASLTTLPLVDVAVPSSPKEPSLIYQSLPEEKLSSSPLIDTLRPRSSPKEPSRIHNPLHGAHKHPYPSNPTDSPMAELPLKRIKVNEYSPSSSFKDSREFNTVIGDDQVDFSFSNRTSSNAISLEEAERADRIKRKANPILLGKFSRVQKELLTKANSKPAVVEKASTVVLEKTSGLLESLSEAKDALLEKGHNLIDSTMAAVDHAKNPLRQSLDEIAQEATVPIPSFRPLHDDDSESIEFVWPRVPESFKAAEEAAREERINNKPSTDLFNMWKPINAEILSKWSSSKPGFIYASQVVSDKADSMIGKASKMLDDAIQYTTEKIEQLGLGQASEHDLEWFRLQEEKERARRINESPLMPSSKINKARVEQQLLDAARRIRSQQ